jgi:hypothetical protein
MLVSGGKIIAIDEIKTTSATLSGDGIWTELGLNTSATIDPIKNDISSLSSTITNISGDLYKLSGDVVNISGDLYNLSGDVSIISGDLYNLSGDVYNISSNVNIISGDIIEVSSKVEENYTYITSLSSDIDFISGELDAETSAIEEDIDYLSAAIDTKQKQLSAGQYVELVENDDYDTINITGINPSTFFTAQMNRHSSSEYFTFDGHTLSASDKIGYFNLSIGYKVSTTDTYVDNYYESIIKVNGTDVDTQYIEGAKPCENHYISQNILNDAANHTYEFLIEKDNGLDISNMNITCIGFIGEANNIDVGVLGTNGAILTFGNTILRV